MSANGTWEEAESYPQPHGFDVTIGGTLWGAPQSFFCSFRGEQYFRGWRYAPDLEPGGEGDYLTDRLTDKAQEILDRVADRPFLLNLWHHTVHTPIEGKAELVAKYASRLQPGAVHANADYTAMVKSLDTNVGRVLAQLDEKGIAERTIVVFCSDNGGFVNTCKLHPGRTVMNNAPLRSGKGSLYEGGIRIPMIVRAPMAKLQGAVCDESISACDLYPTLLDLVGLSASGQNDPLDRLRCCSL